MPPIRCPACRSRRVDLLAGLATCEVCGWRFAPQASRRYTRAPHRKLEAIRRALDPGTDAAEID